MSEITSVLHARMASFTTHTFLPFLTSQQQALAHQQQEFDEAHQAAHEEAQAARTEHERLAALDATQKSDLVVEEARLADLADQVATLELSASTLLPQQVSSLQASLSTREVAQATLQKEINQLTSIHVREVDAVTRGVRAFRDRLGVNFLVQDGKLQIVYTLISREAPEKQFTVSIFIDENKEYQLHACAPEVPTMQTMVEELNRTNNFARFIGQARKQFMQVEAAVNEEDQA